MINRIHSQFISVKTSFFGFKNYSYILYSNDGESVAIVDPAWDMNVFTSILEERPVSRVMVLLTHSHIDHVNLVDKFITRYQAEIYISKEESEYYVYRKKNLHLVTDGSRIPFGTEEIQCILTPGHTVGGMCYLKDGTIFTGDTLFIEGCGACFGPGGDARAMYHTIQRIKSILSKDTMVYPGHCYGQEVGQTIDYLLEHNIYMQIDDIEKFIQFRNRKEQKGIFRFL